MVLREGLGKNCPSTAAVQGHMCFDIPVAHTYVLPYTGAFPEIHVAQYPLDMGKADRPSSDSTLAVTVGADGNVNYDAIVKQGRNKDKYIATTHDAMVPKVDRLKDGVCLLNHFSTTPETHLSSILPWQSSLGCYLVPRLHCDSSHRRVAACLLATFETRDQVCARSQGLCMQVYAWNRM